MAIRFGRFLAAAGILVLSGLAVWHCSKPAAAPASGGPDLMPVVTIKELMESIIDPIADDVFDAVTTDVGPRGIVDTRPTTDDDWAKVRNAAVTLAESSNLLKMVRSVAPPGDKNNSDGPNAPELSPQQIQARIDAHRAQWNKYADELRAEAVKILEIVKARNVDALFDGGSQLHKACENCHLEYWYPGDRKAVLEDEQKRATMPSKR